MLSLRQSRRPSLALATGFLLAAGLSGCTSLPSTTVTDSAEDDAVYLTSEQKDDLVERRAEAAARFAEGLSHEIYNRDEKAIESFFLAIEADPSNETLALDVSRRLMQDGEEERALKVLDLVNDAGEGSFLLHAQRGSILARLGRTEEAIEANRKAVAGNPDALIGHFNLFMLLMGEDRHEEALEVIDNAAKTETGRASFWLDIAGMYASFMEAVPERSDDVRPRLITVLDRARDLEPEGLNQMTKLADGYLRAGRQEQATEVYLELLNRLEDSPGERDQIRRRLVELFIRENNPEDAFEQLEALVQSQPSNVQANYLLGLIARELQQPGKAIEYLSRTLTLQPDFRQAALDLVLTYLNSGQPKEALAQIDKLRDGDSPDFILEYYAGLAHGQDENYAEAVDRMQSAELIGKTDRTPLLNHFFYFQYGSFLEREKRYDEAAEAFERSLELNPDFAPAMNYLGYMWADLGVHLEEAREWIQKAVDQEPENEAFLDSLGWVLFKLGKTAEALPWIEKAIELSEEPDPTLYDHLGDIHAALGQTEQAIEAWEKSLEVEEDPAIRKKLESARDAQAKPES